MIVPRAASPPREQRPSRTCFAHDFKSHFVLHLTAYLRPYVACLLLMPTLPSKLRPTGMALSHSFVAFPSALCGGRVLISQGRRPCQWLEYFTPLSTCLKSISFHIPQEKLWDRSARRLYWATFAERCSSVATRKDAMLSLTLQSRLGPDTVISKSRVCTKVWGAGIKDIAPFPRLKCSGSSGLRIFGAAARSRST